MTQLSELATSLHEEAVADYKVSERFAYRFIMKVKRIRDERLYKELGFSSFDDYCAQSWKVVRRYMDERIQIAESFGKLDFESTYSQIGHSKSLLLARMEPEIRQKVENSIDVNEATVRQMKELERQAKEAESKALKAEQESRHWQGVAKSIQNQPPRVVTQTVEKVPVTVEAELADLRFKAKQYEAGYREARAKLEQYELLNTEGFNEEQAELQKKKMQNEADMSTIQLSIIFKNFIEKAAITPYMIGALAVSNPFEKKRLQDQIEIAERIISETKSALMGRKLGGIVNE